MRSPQEIRGCARCRKRKARIDSFASSGALRLGGAGIAGEDELRRAFEHPRRECGAHPAVLRPRATSPPRVRTSGSAPSAVTRASLLWKPSPAFAKSSVPRHGPAMIDNFGLSSDALLRPLRSTSNAYRSARTPTVVRSHDDQVTADCIQTPPLVCRTSSSRAVPRRVQRDVWKSASVGIESWRTSAPMLFSNRPEVRTGTTCAPPNVRRSTCSN